MKIYGDTRSGNCYKLKLLCCLLSLEHEWIEIDIMAGGTRSDEFLALNPNGQIPVCVTNNGDVLTESNAILFYLSEGSAYWPADRLAQTRVLEWQFFEQYTHEPSIAVARFIQLYQGMPKNRRDEYQQKVKAGYRALDLMESWLSEHEFLVSGGCTIADISLYAYTHVAHEGGFDLAEYQAINAWIQRIENLPGYIGMNS